MEKYAYFFIDDTIWCMRDVTRERPASLFDNKFFAMLKKGHDEYGMTVQLNLFYRTDFYYGGEEFNLSQMTDAYKAEFEEASDWLKLTFHAKQEFPDYPYVNADYADVKRDCLQVLDEIKRFAGAKSIARAVVPHWLPISKEGCQALVDCGIKFVSPSAGQRLAYEEYKGFLSGSALSRYKYNHKPETVPYTRIMTDGAAVKSICSYNHISEEQEKEIFWHMKSVHDEETGINFKKLGGGPCLNKHTPEKLAARLEELNGSEYIGVCVHEQYYYPYYSAYQPDYAEKVWQLGRTLTGYGYKFITADDMR